MVVCPVIAVAMLESGGELCSLCGECCLTPHGEHSSPPDSPASQQL